MKRKGQKKSEHLGKNVWFGGLLFIVFAVVALLVVKENPLRRSTPVSSALSESKNQAAPKTLAKLLAVPPIQIQEYDIALLNLLCAEGLPGANNFVPAQFLPTLDQWAQRVKAETERHLHRFRVNPAEYEHSEAYFRMLIMAVVLYEDFGIRYNPERVAIPSASVPNDHFFADSRDIFIHGLLGDRKMGTCSSMPVLYLAIGRRLGYPLKLVTTKAHLFLRWEDAKERFNLEATGKGMNRYSDDHFKKWPFPVTEEEIRTEGYLKSLTAAEELAVFLSLRGNCLKEAGRFDEAAASYTAALRYAPDWNAYKALLADVQIAKPRVQSRRQVSQTGSPLPTQTGPDPNPLRQVR